MKSRVKARLRSEQGFGLIELVIAMVMLNIGILAIVAAFNSGALALQRASQTSTASVLADKQMELYRALNYSAIALHTASKTTADANSTYAGDPCVERDAGDDDVQRACRISAMRCGRPPVRRRVLPDRHVHPTEPISTYVAGAAPSARDVKRVTVVIRKTSALKTLARVTSTFDRRRARPLAASSLPGRWPPSSRADRCRRPASDRHARLLDMAEATVPGTVLGHRAARRRASLAACTWAGARSPDRQQLELVAAAVGGVLQRQWLAQLSVIVSSPSA